MRGIVWQIQTWYQHKQTVSLRLACRSKEAFQAWAYKQIPDTFPELWGWVIFVLISMFAISCINTLAQSYKVWLDEQQQEAEHKAAKQQ